MPKPTISKHSTLVEMKAFVRKHKLNHPSVKLGMKKAEMLSALDKLGHINTEPRPKKTKAPKPPPPAKKKFKIDQSKQPKQTPSKIKMSVKPKLNTKKIKPKSKETWRDWVAGMLYKDTEIPVIYHYNPDKKVFEVYYYNKDYEGTEFYTDYIGSLKKRVAPQDTFGFWRLNQKDTYALDKAYKHFKGHFHTSIVSHKMMAGEYGVKKEAEEEREYYFDNI